MVIRPVYKKEVSTLPNKMKYISPLQRHVFLPQHVESKKNHKVSTMSPPFYYD